jgi:hypothetical protein
MSRGRETSRLFDHALTGRRDECTKKTAASGPTYVGKLWGRQPCERSLIERFCALIAAERNAG